MSCEILVNLRRLLRQVKMVDWEEIANLRRLLRVQKVRRRVKIRVGNLGMNIWVFVWIWNE